MLSISPAIHAAPHPDNKPITGFDVLLADTVLFPEGGGQPSDRGTLNGLPVLHVRRDPATGPVHFVPTADDKLPFCDGDAVDLVVDWPLRHDHMQQHSGQHLLSAILEQKFNVATVSWYLGAETSYVQLNTPALSPEQLREAEDCINEHIAAGCAVSVQTIADVADVQQLELDEGVKRATRGLPADHSGPVRIITFAGIDSNLCCGTHVRNLSQLQAIKLLHTETGGSTSGKKKKATSETAAGKTVLLHFIVGTRVLRFAEAAHARERQLNVALGCEKSAHVEMVHKWQEKVRNAQRHVKRLQHDMAAFEARAVEEAAADGGYYFVHRTDGDDGLTYLKALAAAVQRKEDVLLFGTTVEERREENGRMLLQGRPADVAVLAPQLDELLGGKGFGKGGQYQSKVGSLKRLKECEALVREYFEQKCQQ